MPPSSYKPYLISNIKQGIELDRDPWILPKDAFKNLENMYVFQGVIKKRLGYSLFAKLPGIKYTDENKGTTTSNSVQSWTLSHTPVLPKNLTLTIAGGFGFTDATGTGTETTSKGTFTIDYDTGLITADYTTPPSEGIAVTATYNLPSTLPVMGIFNYVTESGTEQLVVFTTRFMYYWDDINLKFVSATDDEVFTGGESNYFWMTNWKNVAYICNGVDQIMKWDGSTLSEVWIDIDSDAVSEVSFAQYIFPYKDRLVLLRTQESGFGCFQRARWCKVGQPTDWTNDGWSDAPVNDWIIAAGFLKDDLIVWFERSIWALRYTGSSALPFKWVRLVSQEGSVSPMSLQEFSDELMAFGNVSIVGFDGRSVYNLAEKLSNYVLEMNQEAINYSYGGVDEERRQAWWTFPSLQADRPDKVLIYGYDDNTWSIYDMPLSCFGYYQESKGLTWDDMDVNWDDVDMIWDQRDFQSGFPRMLAGNRQGVIFELNKGIDDNGIPIYSEIVTTQWNPFTSSGKSAVLGQVDFLVDRNENINLLVEFYMNSEDVPYMSKTINLVGDNPDKSGDKVWVRVDCGADANFHQLKISGTGKQFTIHAIMPWFKEGGDFR